MEDVVDESASRRRRISFPSAYTVLMAVIAVAAIATWVLPAGTYETLAYDADVSRFVLVTPDGEQTMPASQSTLDSLGVAIPFEKFQNGDIRRPVAVPGTYAIVPADAQGPLAILQAPIRGLQDAIDVVLFVLVIGGFIEVFGRSGAFEAGIGLLARRLQGRESVLIILLTSLFALGGSTFGMGEECIAFYPLLVPVFLAAGYDVMVPLAVIFLGAGSGFMVSTVNPFATIIASDAAGINWTVGLTGRIVMLVLVVAICIAYILRYARTVKTDSSRSLAGRQEGEIPAASHLPMAPVAMTGRIRILLFVFAATFAVMIVGVSRLGWWFTEMTTLFLGAAMLVGLLQGGGEKAFTQAFVKGAESLLGVALIIGIARGVTVILNDGQVSATILSYGAAAVEGMPRVLFIVSLMLVFAGLTLFISSASGMAVVTMPIMGSLAGVVGVPAEEIVNAYLYGFGLMSIVTPTGLILPSLAMVNVSYAAWLRFIAPLLGILALVSMLALSIGVLL
jgi:uncharacterized ion transporter superfamily protein YfcC